MGNFILGTQESVEDVLFLEFYYATNYVFICSNTPINANYDTHCGRSGADCRAGSIWCHMLHKSANFPQFDC